MSVTVPQLNRFALGLEVWHANPFSIKVKKGIWSIATDGYVMLAVKTPGAPPSKGNHPEELEDLLSITPKDFTEIELPKLKAWAGNVPTALVPSVIVEVGHQGLLLDCVIDKRRLAFLFAKIDVLKVIVWKVSLGNGFLGFIPPQDQWRAFIGRVDAEPDPSISVFQIKVPEKPLSALEIAELGCTTK